MRRGGGVTPGTRRSCGRMRYRGTALPDWWGGSDAPLIYATFGTVLGYMSIAADVYRTLSAAVQGTEARCC